MRYTVLFMIMWTPLLWMACGERESAKELLSKAEAFEKEEKFDEALHAYDKLAKRYPEDENADDALYKVAFLYYNNVNDFHRAIEYHRRLVEKYPDSELVPKARFMIGFIYANNIKDFDKARAAYNEFLELYPEDELVESVKWELEHLGQEIDEQMLNLFGEESNGKAVVN